MHEYTLVTATISHKSWQTSENMEEKMNPVCVVEDLQAN